MGNNKNTLDEFSKYDNILEHSNFIWFGEVPKQVEGDGLLNR